MRRKRKLTLDQEKVVLSFIKTRTVQSVINDTGLEYYKVKRILNSVTALEAIKQHDKQVRDNVLFDEITVINKLWEEATNMNKNTGAMRISALKLIGEHIGMWQDQKQKPDEKIIVNYVNFNPIQKPAIEADVIQEKLTHELPPGVTIQEYDSTSKKDMDSV